MKELKALALLELISMLEISGDIKETIDESIKELEELNNRSCESCKYFCIKEIGLFGGYDTEQYNSCNNNINISKLDINMFYCNRYEKKGSK